MAVPRRFSNRLIYTILKLPLAAGEEPRSKILPLAKVALKAHARDLESLRGRSVKTTKKLRKALRKSKDQA